MSPRRNNKRKHSTRSSAPPSFSTDKVKISSSTLAELKLPTTVPEESGTETYLDNIRKFLNGKLPPFKKSNHIKSDHTRSPAFFDMHLHKDLRLEKIVFLRHLPKVLSEVCDEMLQNIPEDDPREAPCHVMPQKVRKVKHENALAAEYNKVVKPHQVVASQLLFNTTGEDKILVMKVNSQDKKQTSAIADSFVYLNPPQNGSLTKEHQDNIDLLEKHQLQNILVYEFKSLECGPGIMKALKTFGGDFTWTTCQERCSEDEPSSRCSSKNHRIDGRPMVTGRKTGPDSAATKDIIAECMRRESHDHGEQEQHMSEPDSDSEGEGSLEKRPRISEEATSNNDTRKEKKEKKKIGDAKKLMQQTWTEAVAEDATFMIISYGKKECVAIRSREFRTLYISEPLTTSTAKSPPHAKLLVSTFIHSYRDACARVREMERCLNPIGNAAAISQRHADILGPLYNLHIDKENKPTTRNSKASKTRKPAEKSVLNEQSRELQDKRVLEVLKKSNIISLRFHETKLLVNSNNPNTWRLTRTEPLTPTGLPPKNSNEFLFLDIEEKITERVYESYLCLFDRFSNRSIFYSSPVYIKLGRKESESKKLLTEYDMYQTLNATEGNPVPDNLGLFSYRPLDCDSARWHFLLLDNAGTSFLDRFGRKTPEDTTNIARHVRMYQNIYRENMEFLHSLNFSHNDIDARHVMLRVDSKKAGLISLSNCAALTEASKNGDIKGLEGLFSS